MNYGLFALTGVEAEASRKAAWNLHLWLVDKLGVGGTTNAIWIMLGGILLCMVVPYLLGSINPAIIFSKLIFHDDIRTHGSGNAGATNTLRTYGKKMAALIFILDLLKAALAIIFGSLVLGHSMGGAISGLFVILGHMFPIYYRFKGGKGVACFAMVALMLSPISFCILVPIFIAIVLLSRYVSLGSVMCVLIYPMIHHAFYRQEGWITLSGFAMMVLIVFMHRENIKRIMAGTESKLSLGRKRRKKASYEGEEK